MPILKKIASLLLSMQAMAIGLLLFAAAIGTATFIENDYGTPTAKALVYNAQWFELLYVWLAANLIANMVRFGMFKEPTRMRTVFHAAFLIILLGAAITRYFGYEGTLHIREGATNDTMFSQESYIQANLFTQDASGALVSTPYEKSMLFSKLGGNSFDATLSGEGKSVEVELVGYMPSASYALIEEPSGIPMIEMMIAGTQGPQNILLGQSQTHIQEGLTFDFESNSSMGEGVRIMVQEGKLVMQHLSPLFSMSMDTQEQKVIEPALATPLESRMLYALGDVRFVLKNFTLHGTKKLISKEDEVRGKNGMNYPDALTFRITYGALSKEIVVMGSADSVGTPVRAVLGDVGVEIAYGAKLIKLPFALRLDDFVLERYAGSMAPSSYSSHVTLIDEGANVTMPYHIYMNHVLDYQGFRFFQSSFDQDELGTVLSVNNDPGTFVTYIGYALLALGMFGILFVSKGRFASLRKKLAQVRQARTAVAIAALLLAFGLPTASYAQHTHDEPIVRKSVDAAHAKTMGRVLLQTADGRLQPFDSLARDILIKVSKKSTFEGQDAVQAVLSMMLTDNDAWHHAPIIRVEDGEVLKLLGLDATQKYASFVDFYPNGIEDAYILEQYVNDARRKAPKMQNRFDKALLKVDERVHIVNQVFGWHLFAMFPIVGDANNKWVSLPAAYEMFTQHVMKEEQFVQMVQLFRGHYLTFNEALKTDKWESANSALEALIAHQKSSPIYPDEMRIDWEIAYNSMNIFVNLMVGYLIVGGILLIVAFAHILKPTFAIGRIAQVGLILLGALFLTHTLGLAMRWVIAQHAPWSNGYEAMIYIGWSAALAGLLTARSSLLTLSATALMAGVTLLVAMLSSFDPQITNLVPVLKSYWLTIHVSMITASYGFLGLSALLGVLVLVLMWLVRAENQSRIMLAIQELNLVNEMSIIIGLVLLTIGNFLGGVWANESWGRYWGWDAKETWALVSILIYAAVAHMRSIPKLYNDFRFAMISVVSFGSIIMTFFGVNYYLSGLHSYAKGDPVPVPSWVYYALVLLAVLMMGAYVKYRKIKEA
ncbi:MAG: hypothetical protein KU37_10895 [Sulfuricurvum sp. PC08-66]|nr:MAG: hypothetical protein KU37_10895 [Sulfuricurvum sp. PC08-66]